MTYKDLKKNEFIKKLFTFKMNIEDCTDNEICQFFFEIVVIKRKINDIIKNKEKQKPRFIKGILADIDEFKKRNKELLIQFDLMGRPLPKQTENQLIVAHKETTGEEYIFTDLRDVSTLFGIEAIPIIEENSKYNGFVFDVE